MQDSALSLAAVLHLTVTAIWFVSGIILPTRAIWNDALLLVPTFAATGLLLIHSRLLVSRRKLAWGAALLDFLGLVPLGLYVARIIQAPAGSAYAHAVWVQEPVITLFVLALLAATALAHIFTIAVCLMTVYRCGCRAVYASAPADDDNEDDQHY
jgi:hypothetical protein